METLYTYGNYPSKKALKEAVASGKKVEVYSASIFSKGTPNGRHTLCGPSEYQRKYYAEIEVKDGILTKVK